MLQFTKDPALQSLVGKIVIVDVHPWSYAGSKASSADVLLMQRMADLRLKSTI
jgi:hypothetical protein